LYSIKAEPGVGVVVVVVVVVAQEIFYVSPDLRMSGSICTSFLRNVKVIRYRANCTSVLQPLDLGVIKCYKLLYRKRLVQTAVCLMDAGKDTKKKINVLEALHYTVAALQK
jgi:hypothetical protein